jgi:hypothetical protein
MIKVFQMYKLLSILPHISHCEIIRPTPNIPCMDHLGLCRLIVVG